MKARHPNSRPPTVIDVEATKKLNWGLVRFCITCAVLLFYFLCFNHTEPNEIGIARNWITGNMWVQEKPGWHLTSPSTRVAQVDIRPVRVKVATAGHGYGAKLVKFEPKGWEKFVETEGFRYYWWYNRLSFNWGYDEEYRGMKDILRGYAYGAKRYPFFTVLEEYEAK
jgi:hypothetical protein